MTDARVPERYLMDKRIVRLTDAERSSYFMATLWSVSNRTDGRIDRDDLPLIPTFKTASIQALVGSGLWSPTEIGWVDTEFANVQTSKSDLEVLENARRADREKKARRRAANKDSPGDSPRDMSPGQHRTGQDRTGQDKPKFSEDDINQKTGEVVEWPVVAIPRDREPICELHKTPWPCSEDTPDCGWSYPA